MEQKIINVDPEILSGVPVFYGTRVPIKNLFDYLEAGDSIDDFLSDFDNVKREQVTRLLEISPKWSVTKSHNIRFGHHNL